MKKDVIDCLFVTTSISLKTVHLSQIFTDFSMSKRTNVELSPIQNLPKRKMIADDDPLLVRMTDLMISMRDDLLKGQSVMTASVHEEIRDGILTLKSEVTEELKSLSGGLSTVSDVAEKNSHRLDDLVRRVKFLEEENMVLKGWQVDQENRGKRSNLVLHGMSENISDNGLEAEFLRVCSEVLQLDRQIIIERIHRVGNKSSHRPRTVVVKFLNYKDRLAVWNQRRLLKGSRLYLEEHFAIEIQQSRAQLLPYLQAARCRGEKASLVADKLWINNQKFGASEGELRSLQLRYDETKSRSEAEISTEEGPAVCFYGRHSVFSNFHLTPMEVSGQKYASNEHFYTIRKCEMSGHSDLAERAAQAKFPGEANAIGRNIKLNDEDRLEVMRTGLLAKVHQNPRVKEALRQTGKKLIAEASPVDLFWGTGCGLHSQDLAKKNMWKGQNQMGLLWMKIRDELFLESN